MVSSSEQPIPAANDSVQDLNALLTGALFSSDWGVLLADNEGKIRYVSPRLEQITGYSAAELIGRNPRVLQSGNTSRETYLGLWNTISSGRPWSGVLKNKRKDGTNFWEAIKIVPIKDIRGAITNYVGIIEDITAQKVKQEQDEQIDREITQAEHRSSLLSLSAVVAHEFSNILTAILGNLMLAGERTARDEFAKKYIQQALQATSRAVELTLSFQTFAGVVPELPQPNDLGELVETIVPEVLTRIPPSTKFSFGKQSDPCVARVSPALIKQLIKTALDYAVEMTDGAASIQVSVGVHDSAADALFDEKIDCGLPDRPAVFLEFKHTGRGMNSAQFAHAFDPHLQISGTRSSLGLASVLGVARCHGGRILLRSDVAAGTTLRVVFAADSAPPVKSSFTTRPTAIYNSTFPYLNQRCLSKHDVN